MLASRIHSGAHKTETTRHHQNASVIMNHSGTHWRRTELWGGEGGDKLSAHCKEKKERTFHNRVHTDDPSGEDKRETELE